MYGDWDQPLGGIFCHIKFMIGSGMNGKMEPKGSCISFFQNIKNNDKPKAGARTVPGEEDARTVGHRGA